MPKVAVKIVPWLSEAFGASRTLVLEQEVGEDESPLGLLQKLAERNVSLRGNIFDDSQGGIQGDILIVLNGRLVCPTGCRKDQAKERGQDDGDSSCHGRVRWKISERVFRMLYDLGSASTSNGASKTAN